MSVVLCDGAMEDGSVLGPQSLLMKGKVVPGKLLGRNSDRRNLTVDGAQKRTA